MVSSPKRRTSISGSKTARPSGINVGVKGHVYEYQGWSSDRVIKRDDAGKKVTVTLKDITAGEMITRNGKIYMLGDPVIFIDSLEGCKEVQVCLHAKGEHGKVTKLTPSSGYRLQEI
jgi:hypothetical protein